MDNSQNKVVEVRRAYSRFQTSNELWEFRNDLLGRCQDYWTVKAYQDCNDQNAGGIWALVVHENSDEVTTNGSVIAYEEYDDFTETFDAAMSFKDWVSIFSPSTHGDWLMAPKLFRLYLLTGKNLPDLVATHDPWIDAVLSESRGMLMWSHQFIEIVRMVAGVSHIEATRTYTSYILRKEGGLALLAHIYPPTNQTLLQIIEERTVGIQSLGAPNYLIASRLSENFALL
jgi:hypothetical protein